MLYDLDKVLTILRESQSTPNEADPQAQAQVLALHALGWVLSDGDRAQRLLALTGLTPDALRGGLGDPSMLGAVLDFLASHEPDLIAAADALGVEPRALVDAAGMLAR